MRLHSIRIHISPCAPGMLSVGMFDVVYKGGRVVGSELLYNDWCEADELLGVLDPVLQLATKLSNEMPGRQWPTP
jgi:hypothetical protein